VTHLLDPNNTDKESVYLRRCSPAERDQYIAEKVLYVRKKYKQILIETLLKQKH